MVPGPSIGIIGSWPARAICSAMLDGGFRTLAHEGLRAAEARAGDMASDLQDRRSARTASSQLFAVRLARLVG